MPAIPKVDWLAVEPDFRAGILSLDAIGAKHGCSGTAVRKEAKRRGWIRGGEALKAERVRTALAAGSEGSDGKVNETIAAEAERDIRVMRTAADFYENVIVEMSARFPELKQIKDQKTATETAVLATTQYRKLRGLEDRPNGRSIEDLLEGL